jgi:hypothetical protein
MFYWTSGMSLFGFIFVAIATVFMFRFVIGAFRGHGWEMDTFPPIARPRGGNVSREWICERANCRAHNPGHGKFCRMCGERRRGMDD